MIALLKKLDHICDKYSILNAAGIRGMTGMTAAFVLEYKYKLKLDATLFYFLENHQEASISTSTAEKKFRWIIKWKL